LSNAPFLTLFYFIQNFEFRCQNVVLANLFKNDWYILVFLLGSAGYGKEVHTVEHIHVLAVDDDRHSFIGDTSHGPLRLLENDGSRHSVSMGANQDRDLQQYEFSINPESSSPGIEMRNSSHFRSSPANGHTSSGAPESESNVRWCLSIYTMLSLDYFCHKINLTF